MSDSEVWRFIGDINALLEKDQKLSIPGYRSPDFLICGAAKAGTTSLFHYLSQHPSIYTPFAKEPGYFSALRTYAQSPEKYASLFEQAGQNQKVGEASTAYLTSPDSALRIASAVPEARIIVMLRNPADRAFSHYRWMTREGWEYAPSFQEALRLEQKRRVGNPAFVRDNPEYYYNYLYFRSGLYCQYIERYLDAFPADQIHFMLFEEFVQSPVDHAQAVYRFLGVDDTFQPKIKVHNKGRDVWSPRFQYFIRQKLRPAMNTVSFPSRVRICSNLMAFNKAAEKNTIPLTLRKALLNRYEENIRETEELVGLPLSETWL